MSDLVINLPVGDVNRTVDFYRDVLGFELVGATGKGAVTRARLRSGAVEILFRSVQRALVFDRLDPADVEDRVILHIRVEDVRSLYERARGRAVIFRDLETTLFGTGEFAVLDPDGVVLSFSQGHAAVGRQDRS